MGYGRGVVTAFPLQATAPPPMDHCRSACLPAVEVDHLWVAGPDGLRFGGPGGPHRLGPVPLPPQRVAVAATIGGLVLDKAGGGIKLW